MPTPTVTMGLTVKSIVTCFPGEIVSSNKALNKRTVAFSRDSGEFSSFVSASRYNCWSLLTSGTKTSSPMVCAV